MLTSSTLLDPLPEYKRENYSEISMSELTAIDLLQNQTQFNLTSLYPAGCMLQQSCAVYPNASLNNINCRTIKLRKRSHIAKLK